MNMRVINSAPGKMQRLDSSHLPSPLLTSWGILMLLFGILLLLSSCATRRSTVPTRVVQIQQTWQLQPGERVGSYRVAGGLGDISIELNRGKVYAPFHGRVQPNIADCVIFSSPEVPAYLFRLCGMHQIKLGQVRQGEAIGSATHLQFAALRRQPNGTWAMVEPARDILERFLQ